MRTREADYSKCWLNPYKPKFLSNIQKELTLFKEFDDSKLGKKRVYQWIVMMYDPNSPWRMEEAQYYNRKREAAKEVGWIIEQGRFDDDVEKFLTGQDKVINAMVASFISRFANPEYTQLIGLLELQHLTTKSILAGKYTQHTTKILNDITNDINRITNRLYGSGEQDEVLLAKKALYQEAEESRIRLNPENIAKVLQEDGELPDDFNPYGDYETEDIHFISDEGEEETKRKGTV